VLAAGAGLLTAFVLPRLAPSWSGSDRLAAVIVADVYVAIIIGHLLAFNGWRGVRHALRLQPSSPREILAACSWWAVGWIVAGVLYLVLTAVWPLTYVRDALLWIGADGGRLADPSPLVVAVAAGRAVLLAPVAEELLFRGALYGWLRRRLTAPTAVIMTALPFAFAHPLPVLWPAALCFGIVAAAFRERSGNLTPVIAIHVVNSVALIAVSYMLGRWNVPRVL
jgi:hypothetical protein